MKHFFILLSILLLFIGCSDKDENTATGPEEFKYDAPWPEDMNTVYSFTYSDSINDQVQMPVEQAGPPYSDVVVFPPIDIVQAQLGIDSTFLYMRVDYLGSIPGSPVVILQSGEVESQTVGNQGMNIAMNTDNLPTGGGGEGVNGIDIFFAVGFEYGIEHKVYANFDFPDGDLHHNQQQVIGELGYGGPGFDYAVVRYDISNLVEFFPFGDTVAIGSWSEAESFNSDGSLKYHHFAFDPLEGTSWVIPQN